MADEIENANVIRVVKEGNQWLAWIGQDPQVGITGSGLTPAVALLNLVSHCLELNWPFDSTWRPRADRI